MKTIVLFACAVLFFKLLVFSGIAFANPILLKNGDRAMIRVTEAQDVLVKVVYIYEDGSVKICTESPNKDDFFAPNCNFSKVLLSDLIQPVSDMEGFKLGDRVCLNKKISSFDVGACGRLSRIYENGKAELITFSLFGVRNHMNTYDVLVDISDIDLKRN